MLFCLAESTLFRPITVLPDATGLVTTACAPTVTPSSSRMSPSTVAPAPTVTRSPICGCRSRVEGGFPVPPSVTLWRKWQWLPIVAVSPMTTPVAWSKNMGAPILAPGCMSTPNTSLQRHWIQSAVCQASSADTSLLSRSLLSSASPSSGGACGFRRASAASGVGSPERIQSRCPIRCNATAWKPLKNKNGWRYDLAAGSKVVMASRSSDKADGNILRAASKMGIK
mmetsp:Transcript_34913/g.78891  ORF Transcript_34913/g.78891 Transcript_34913/m.78891 type:complete len:226 (-) Transcript_34913:481-1158(-)